MKSFRQYTIGFVAGIGLVLGILIGVNLGVVVEAQGGPFNAQIENFWRLISSGGRTFSNLQTVNANCSGTCTGFGGASFTGTQAQWTRGDGTFSQTMVGGTVTASTPWAWTQTWNQGGTTFDALNVTVTKTASAAGSRYFTLANGTGNLFSVKQDATNANDICVELNTSGTIPLSLFPTTANGQNALGVTLGCGSTTSRALYSNGLYLNGALNGGASVQMVTGSGGRINSGSGMIIGWSNTADNGLATIDTAIARNGAGILEVNNGTAGTFRDLLARALQTNPTTVGALPSCAAGLKGQRQFVTDANANTFHTTAAAGGANNVAVVCDGTNWYID